MSHGAEGDAHGEHFVRRAARWAFPRPRSVAAIAWATVCGLYAVAVLVVGIGEMVAVLEWDGEGGAIIPVLTFFFTLPSSLLMVPLIAVSNVPVFWTGLILAGWFQAWWVWRGGLGVARSLARGSGTPLPAPAAPTSL